MQNKQIKANDAEAAALISPSEPHTNDTCNHKNKTADRWKAIVCYYILSASKKTLSYHSYIYNNKI